MHAYKEKLTRTYFHRGVFCVLFYSFYSLYRLNGNVLKSIVFHCSHARSKFLLTFRMCFVSFLLFVSSSTSTSLHWFRNNLCFTHCDFLHLFRYLFYMLQYKTTKSKRKRKELEKRVDYTQSHVIVKCVSDSFCKTDTKWSLWYKRKTI